MIFWKERRLWKASAVVGIIGAVILGLTPAILELQGSPSEENKGMLAEVGSVTPLPTATPTPTPVVPTVTRERIIEWSYGTDDAVGKIEAQDKMRTVILGGDVMLGRAVGFNITRLRDEGYPFNEVATEMKQADLTIVNLENPIVEDCPLRTDGMIFCSSPLTTKTLLSAGIDMVTLANNHTLNYGVDGLEQTKHFLSLEDIAYTGTGTMGIEVVRGVTFGMLGYTQFSDGSVLPKAEADQVVADVEKLKDSVDVLIVTFHWGNEYENQPSVGHRMLAMKAVDAGADLVFGHHPHWVQGFEVYKDTPIFYSLGNLVFDQMWSTETREGLVVQLSYYDDDLFEVELWPVFMEDFAQPVWQVRGKGNVVLDKLDRLSAELERSQAEVMTLLE